MFLDLPHRFAPVRLTVSELAIINCIICARFGFAYGGAHCVRYVLDPCYCGARIDDQTRNDVADFTAESHILGHEDAVTIELLRFHAHMQQTPSSRELTVLIDSKISVAEFWRGLHRFLLLQTIALRKFNATCSSAAAERDISTNKLIHFALRNRFTEGKVKELVHIFFNAKNIDKEDLPLYDMVNELADESTGDECGNQDSDFEYY